MPAVNEVTAQLVQQAQAEQGEALEQLLSACYPRLIRSAAYLMKDRDAAQDVVQETLIKLALNLGQIRRPAAFASWAQTILQREVIRFRKAQRRGTCDGSSYDDTRLECQSAAPDLPFDPSEEMATCLRRLQADDRSLLSLHYWCGLEVKEIAAVLGIAVGAVKTRLFRARQRLGLLLNEPESGIAQVNSALT